MSHLLKTVTKKDAIKLVWTVDNLKVDKAIEQLKISLMETQ